MSASSHRTTGAVAAAGAAIAAAILAVACDSSTPTDGDPCGIPGACEVTGGYDLSVAILEPVAATIPAGSRLEVRYIVRNRGDRRSPAVDMVVCFQPGCDAAGNLTPRTVRIQALDPGRFAEDTVAWGTSSREHVPNLRVLARLEWGSSEPDLVPGNDDLETVPITLELPDLQADADFSAMEATAGEGVEVVGRILNAALVAEAAATESMVCLGTQEDVCAAAEQTVDAPAIGPAETHTRVVDYALPVDAAPAGWSLDDGLLSFCANRHLVLGIGEPAVAERSVANNCARTPFTLFPAATEMCVDGDVPVGRPRTAGPDKERCAFHFGDDVVVWPFLPEETGQHRVRLTDLPAGSEPGIRVFDRRGVGTTALGPLQGQGGEGISELVFDIATLHVHYVMVTGTSAHTVDVTRL